VGDDLTVLVIEDEDAMRRFLRTALANQGYTVIEAITGTEGMVLAAHHGPDLVVLDLGLPEMDGIEVTRRLREWTQAAIIVVSARGQERDKVQALDEGADDYLSKPFGLSELLARIRVAIRHAQGGAPRSTGSILTAGPIQVDIARRRVVLNGREVRLTPTEYKLLVVLLRHNGRVLTHRQLLKEVWGPQRAQDTHYLHVYMGHLRGKLEADPARPRLLLSNPGVGYRLEAG
jgi:two-component system KDP operon response regulator KdpE